MFPTRYVSILCADPNNLLNSFQDMWHSHVSTPGLDSNRSDDKMENLLLDGGVSSVLREFYAKYYHFH